MRGLYIGRFQPYHLGHQAVLERIAEEMDEIVVVIGSAQESHTIDNPFTAGERMDMIYGALGKLRNKCMVIPLQDINRNAIWVSHLRSMVPSFQVVYSSNPLVVQLISEAGIEIRKPSMYQRNLYSGTSIRKFMREGKDWKSLVPGPVASIIEAVRGVERLSNVSGNDASLDRY